MKKYTLPILNQQADTVILANGEFPTHAIPISILHHCKYLVCCDGAINQLYESGITPDIIVGDCDSMSSENQARFANIIHRIPEQETNDLTKAVQFCLQQGKSNIIILGATGQREDHTLGNISLLCEYMEMDSPNVMMVTNYGTFVAIKKPSTFESIAQQQVSIFNIDKNTLTSNNLVYPIINQMYTNWWQATLNEAIGNEFSLTTNGRTIVYRAFL